jgi:hypothetical protein
MTGKRIFFTLAVLIVITILQSCKPYNFRSNYNNTNSLIHGTKASQVKPFLKAHLKNGDVCILKDSWEIDTTLNIVSGDGIQYDYNRKPIYQGSISIPVDSVAIFETNTKITKPEADRITVLGIMAGVDAVLGLVCLINPKACFGSCPTFYINENDNFHYADAEAFTNAISPSMEYCDIDAINTLKISNNSFSITMKNEALETHCINDVKILAYPLEKNQRVYQSPDSKFYLCENSYGLSLASAKEGDVTSLLKNQDRKERYSLSDENNLNAKEEIYLTYNDVNNTENLGLILNFRQTLMTTFLFYNAMGYMGDNVGDVFYYLETNEKMRNNFDSTTKELGGIECYVWNEKINNWEKQAGIDETGPIAINRQLIPLNHTQLNSTVKIKLVLNKGLWRLDYASLTNIRNQVTPREFSPISIYNKDRFDHEALAKINSEKSYLISMPGSEYRFNFEIPGDNTDYDLFLCAKGYYLEWMRENWIGEKDLPKLKQMVLNPQKYLRDEAKNYKQYESTMEQEFWNSKIDTKAFMYYEN